MGVYVCTYTIGDERVCFFTDELTDAREQMQKLHDEGKRCGRIFRVGSELAIGGKHRTTNTRVYLNCPFEQKDEVKERGAKWDEYRKKWYVPFDIELEPFQRWLPNRFQAVVVQNQKKRKSEKDDSVIDFDDFYFSKASRA